MRFSPFILVWICMALKILEFWLIVRLQNDKSWIYCESCLQWKLRQFQSISTLGLVTFCSNREALHKYVRVLKTQFIFIVSNERSKKTYQICSSFSNSFQETKIEVDLPSKEWPQHICILHYWCRADYWKGGRSVNSPTGSVRKKLQRPCQCSMHTREPMLLTENSFCQAFADYQICHIQVSFIIKFLPKSINVSSFIQLFIYLLFAACQWFFTGSVLLVVLRLYI